MSKTPAISSPFQPRPNSTHLQHVILKVVADRPTVARNAVLLYSWLVTDPCLLWDISAHVNSNSAPTASLLRDRTGR